jgi:SSS family solute:Na+ symporter/sodium/proline symporter
VLAVSLVAIALAFDRSASILSLVSNAWAGFGAAFGPIILLSLFWRRFNRDGALAGMVTGALAVLFWIYAPIAIAGKGLPEHLYEIVPGFLLATLAAVVVTLLTSRPTPAVVQRHDHMMLLMAGEDPGLTDSVAAKA